MRLNGLRTGTAAISGNGAAWHLSSRWFWGMFSPASASPPSVSWYDPSFGAFCSAETEVQVPLEKAWELWDDRELIPRLEFHQISQVLT